MIEWCGRARSCSPVQGKPAETIHCTSSLPASIQSSLNWQQLSKLVGFFSPFFLFVLLPREFLSLSALSLVVSALRDSFFGVVISQPYKQIYSWSRFTSLNNKDRSEQGDRSEPVRVYLKQIMRCQEAVVWLLLSDAADYRGNDLKHKAIAAEN